MEKEVKKIKPLVTSRVLFISALDKIYLIILGLTLLILTIGNFAGEISSPYYGFWARVGREIVIIIVIIIQYFIYNWFYKCAVKTVLCLTENQVYKETYIPFKRTETSIPLDKITKVSTHTAFWIFRVIIIHQYHQIPMIFFTWNHQEFKDKLNSLISKEKEPVENIYQNKNIINKDKYKVLMYIGIGLAGIIALIGMVKLFNSIFNKQIDITGRYYNSDNVLTINRDGTCDMDGVVSNRVTDCNWSFNEETNSITIDYSYQEYSYYWGYTTSYDTLNLTYNVENNTIIHGNNTYTK